MIETVPESPDHPDARWCLDQYFSELDRRFETGFPLDPAAHSPDADFVPPTGLFLVARIGGKIAGCGGIKRADAATGEIKRIWTAPQARGRGVARRILRDLEAAARAMGYSAVRLDSNRALPEAHALYRRSDYKECAPFNDDIYAHIWFRKEF